ncbi:hypothetical protein C8R44DRAFT_741934 [Mycena epipterygia]|nr:hypothetical protein C8R44DRAFT_741934 [Mycena epipterygia]
MVGITIGTLMGGPWGAAIGAAITTPIGIFVETTLSPDQQTATIERYIYETLRNAVAAGAGTALAHWVTYINPTTMRAVFSSINDAFGGLISSTVIAGVDVLIYASLKSIIDALTGGPIPREWLEVEAMVAALVEEKKIESMKLQFTEPRRSPLSSKTLHSRIGVIYATYLRRCSTARDHREDSGWKDRSSLVLQEIRNDSEHNEPRNERWSIFLMITET